MFGFHFFCGLGGSGFLPGMGLVGVLFVTWDWGSLFLVVL